ncbi:HAD-IIIC family phosphatase [Streptomyces fragilis]|uniref:HAD-IIIC family phosphatase n=1 Tax=Streptomyces fragilis TaxID=67301 RepID=A0ABV2YHI6_9ACTN|nr:HAD-IIIC family phosphatase [Streptomyces fragilis]
MGDDLSELTRLHRDGSLAAHYPRVRALLAELTGDPLARAGRLLARLDPDDVLAAHPGTPAPLLALTGHGTLTGAVPALTAELARHGLLARVRLSPFDSWVFDLADPASDLYAARPDLVLCLLDAATVTDDLPTPWGADDVARVLEEKLALLERAAEVCATAAPGATLVLNTLPLLPETPAQLLDLRARARLGALWRRAEARLLELPDRHPHVVVVDLLPQLARGVAAGDVRQSVYARAHLSDGLLARYAREVGHLARLSTGGGKKVLALDLDNTVWGGVLGEVGPDGIETDGGYRGEAFRRFQLVVRQLAAQGVLVTAVSKNDLEPVEKTLREHPGLALREEDFVRIRANWRPKHENIAELADELNLGADSFVFVDDSAFERGLVRRELPGVAVVAVDEEPALHPGRLLEDGWFAARELTDEDLVRPARYREERDRRDFLHTFDSLDGYLRELDTTVTVAPAAPGEYARISQITLRTNQFNLTTRRLQPADVRALAADPAALVLGVRAADRFGDHGLVGAVLLRQDGEVLHVDNFLLSCRVFSRGIEQTVLHAVLRHARDSGLREVRAAYRRTPKNGKVADFCPRGGFTATTVTDEETLFRHDLAELPEPAAHIRLTARFGRAPGEGDAP